MMIEDEELRTIFKTASEEHLQNLDDGLLLLEKQPEDPTLLESLLREAHSLKGDANMLGVKDVGTLAHQIEHILGQLKQQAETFSPDLSDRLAHAIAALHRLVREAVTGEPAEIDPFRVLAELMGATATPQPTSIAAGTATLEATAAEDRAAGEEPELPEEQEEPLSSEAAAPAQATSPDSIAGPPPPNAPNSATYRIETIRVATQHLDTLMTQAGELTVTKIRIAHRLADLEAIENLWEEWSRDLFLNRSTVEQVQQHETALQNLAGLHNRNQKRLEELGSLVKSLHNFLYEDSTRLEVISHELEEGIRTLRLLPLSTIFKLFPRMVRDLARQQGKQVELIIEGDETPADKRILEGMKDPLMHILRNAIDHGIESPAERQRLGKPALATIRLRAAQTPTHITIEVSDDGRGLNLEQIKHTALKRGLLREEDLAVMTPQQIQSLIFAPGFSTAPLVTEISGRGVGLDVVQTNVEKLKGTVQVESVPGRGCTIQMQLALTLATAHVLIVQVQESLFAIPVEFVRTACLVKPEEIFTLESRDTILHAEQPLSIAHLSDLLELPAAAAGSRNQQRQLACIVLQAGQEQLGVIVDALVDEQDVVIKPQSQLLKRVRNVAGATILGTGEVCTVLNPTDLIKSVRRRAVSISPALTSYTAPVKQAVLLVEDSIATRTQEKRILEGAGYEVVTAIDGLDGFTKLQSRSFDAVISDVQMPNLDGLGLAARIRQHKEFNEIPIILVTSLASDEDKQRGAEAGASAYITKGSFNQEVLLETLHRLI